MTALAIIDRECYLSMALATVFALFDLHHYYLCFAPLHFKRLWMAAITVEKICVNIMFKNHIAMGGTANIIDNDAFIETGST